MPNHSQSSWPSRSADSPNHRRKTRRRRSWLLSLFLVFLFLLIAGAMVGAGMIFFYAKPSQQLADTFDMDEIDDLEVASVILDRHGEEIGRIFVQNREPISIDEVSPNFVQALLAAEDARFFVHDGVDYVGILRAIWLNIKAGEVTQGASTITQQLARNAFNLKEKSLRRKVTEAFLARRIEREIGDKQKILELYLNRIYFGSGFYGIAAASKGYFGKEAKDLTIPESAMLAGVIRNPYYRSPYNFPDAAKNTRDYVLTRMEAEGMFDAEQLAAYQAEPLRTAPRASAFGRSKYVYERVRQQVIELIGYEQASEGGFVIHTTIDNQVQQAAEETLAAQLDQVEKHPGYAHQTRDVYKEVKKNFLASAAEGATPPVPQYLQGAALMIDNRTGGIVALVGGRDFNDSMFDRTSQARRPPGTAFTPFVYAAAFEGGHFPGSLVDDSPMDNKQVQIGGEAGILGEWGTESESIYEGEITARRALATSRNAAAVRMGSKAGLDKVVALAGKAGIRFFGDIQKFNATLLGKSEVSMEELCTAYTVFPNQGKRPEMLHVISSIKRIDGTQIYAPEPREAPEAAVDAYTAFQISSCLTDALKSGTGSKAYERYGLGDFPAAGKTGTEYGFTDNWFVGYTSEVTCAVWAGFDQPKTIFAGAFSSDTVLPVWSAMMNEAAKSFEPQAFTPPQDAVKVEICAVSGQLATDACYRVEKHGDSTRQVRSTYVEYLRPGTEVTAVCEVHGGPGAIPRTGPSRGPDRSLTLTEGTGGLRAQPMVVSDPIVPVGPTVVGIDPYQSLAPVLRAQIVAPTAIAEEKADESEESPDDTGTDSDPIAMPRAVPVEAGDSPATPRAEPVAVPVARPLEMDPEEESPARRISLPPPRPIQFD
ncbi:MAG: transglycosylase domain-containing protein [Verrucomicrobiales bacterium]|nr:transglycosylase domain-containing protein [Verrucomicrobiales bacterium]